MLRLLFPVSAQFAVFDVRQQDPVQMNSVHCVLHGSILTEVHELRHSVRLIINTANQFN